MSVLDLIRLRAGFSFQVRYSLRLRRDSLHWRFETCIIGIIFDAVTVILKIVALSNEVDWTRIAGGIESPHLDKRTR